MQKKYRHAILAALSFLFFLFSCTRNSLQAIPEISGLSYSHTLPLEYASSFRADVYSDSYILLTVSDTDRYLLVPENHAVPEKLPAGIKPIQLPVQKAYLCASSAMALFQRLDSLDAIRFSSVQKKDWYVEEAVNAMEDGRIVYAGKYNAPDFELLLKEKCPLAIESTMIYHTPQIQEKLEALGITVFVDKSSYEKHPLGRLEWIKVYGMMTGKLDEAEQFFSQQIEKLPARKLVSFFYLTPTGTVVIRGSDDYIVKMIELSGGTYVFDNTRKSNSPSIQISMEEFYARSESADILIYNSSIDNTVHTMDDLLEKNPLFAEFKAVKTGNVWATGKYIYQATDRIGDMILDLQNIMNGRGENTVFLQRVE